MTTAISIAPMELCDLQSVRELDAKVYASHWSLSTWRAEVDKMPAGRVYLTAQRGREFFGHGGVMAQADEGHIVTVAVDPNYHGRSVGTAMMLALARESIGCDLQSMTLEVRQSNVAAQSLYAKFGFVPAGVRPGYYGNDGEDALIMWATDIAGVAYAERLAALSETIADGFVFDANLHQSQAQRKNQRVVS